MRGHPRGVLLKRGLQGLAAFDVGGYGIEHAPKTWRLYVLAELSQAGLQAYPCACEGSKLLIEEDEVAAAQTAGRSGSRLLAKIDIAQTHRTQLSERLGAILRGERPTNRSAPFTLSGVLELIHFAIL